MSLPVISNHPNGDHINSTRKSFDDDAPENVIVELGELCVYGTDMSPSLEIATTSSQDDIIAKEEEEEDVQIPPTRVFRTGDTCYIHPVTHNVYFLGRMAQAVYCGDKLKKIPPVGVEMICLETDVVDRCAFVGVAGGTLAHERDVTRPLIIIQQQFCSQDKDLTKTTLRQAIGNSIWSELLLLDVGLSLAFYPSRKSWPVDVRHSSKTNRKWLQKWAEGLSSHKIHRL